MSVISLGQKLSVKYADDAPQTLRSGDIGLSPVSPMPQISESPFDPKHISVPKIDAGNRDLELLSATKRRLLRALDLMFHAGIVTQSYYLSTRKHMYKSDDMVIFFQQFVKIVADAEKEMAIYNARLVNVKELVLNKK